MAKNSSKLLFTGAEWDFPTLRRIYDTIEDIAINRYNLDPYPNQIEIVSSEQMLDAYASIGLPIMYTHWSYGKRFAADSDRYARGHQHLAYELVANTKPCVSYCMEENSATMQALVFAHACVSGDTEYLGPTGWKRIDQYDGGLVGQYNEDGSVEFVEPSAYIRRPQDKFIHVSSASIDQAITEDHTVVFVNGNGNLVKITGAELSRRHRQKTRGFNGKFITGFQLKTLTKLPLTDDEIRLQIAIKADGNIVKPGDKTHFNAKPWYKIRFHLKKERKINRLIEILNNLGISYTKNDTYGGRVSIMFNLGYLPSKTYDPLWYAASEEQLHLIANEVLLWDGCERFGTFSSANKQDVDFVQFVWCATGKHAHIYEGKRAYAVDMSDKPHRSLSTHRTPPTPMEYIPSEDGLAYCFTVPSHMFVTRRNDKVSVTGNCFGHNHFFKNNYLFKQWTDADGILDYLKFAKDYVAKCEERYGVDAVEEILDAAHALMSHGVDRYNRPKKLSVERERERQRELAEYAERSYNDLWRTVPGKKAVAKVEEPKENGLRGRAILPEENVLYFIEKNSPVLQTWQRELVRIVRKISQYFYPQKQTKVANEGTATFYHYLIMNDLWNEGRITDGSYLEFIHSHTSVVTQPGFDSKYYSGFNPYALGFAMFQDIKRMCEDPTDEDRKWFPDIAGAPWKEVVLDAVANYRDESFILQFLSPKVMRDFKMFAISDEMAKKHYEVVGIHDESGYRKIRSALAREYTLGRLEPDIHVASADLGGTRLLVLQHRTVDDIPLEEESAKEVMTHVRRLWGHPVALDTVDEHGDTIRRRMS